MLEAAHYSAAGARHKTAFALPEPFFDGTVNEAVLHQSVKAYLNNQRQGTAATKTRSFVSGGNQKPWKQKGTGRARQGSTRAPHWRGGGIVFGPQPRSYETDVPRKVRQLARRSALNARAREGALHVVESLAFAEPKTRVLAELLEKLGVAEAKVLVLTATHRPAVYLSSRNLPRVDVLPYADASAYDVLWADQVVVEEAAISGAVPAEAAESATMKPAKKAAKPAKAKAVKKAAAPRPEKKKSAPKAAKPKAEKKAPKKKGGK
ncbi:MAG: 50S ribosomal protein L4 [Gemmatimonadales bacterium]